MKKINWYKLAIYAAVILVIFFLGRSCGNGGQPFGCTISGDTLTHTVDTTVKQRKDSLVYVPVPYKVIEKVPGKTVTDSFTEYDPFIIPQFVDTSQILKLYYSTAYYRDTLKLINGIVIKIDTVTRNTISGAGLILLTSDTVVKETTIIKEQDKKNILYATGSLQGNRSTLFSGIGGGLMLKTKNDRLFGAEVKLQNSGDLFYEARVGIPIRFKSKKQ